MRLRAGLSIAVMLALTSSAHAAPRRLAITATPTPISAYGGYVAFSRYDARNHRWTLMVGHGGVVRPLVSDGRRAAFDVDLGPGPTGRVTAVYSRCHAGCRLFALTLPRGRPHRIDRRGRGAYTSPAIWHHRLAFAFNPRGSDDTRLVVENTTTHAMRQLAVGPRGSCHPCATVESIDIDAAGVAFVWGPVTDPPTGIGPDDDLFYDSLRSRGHMLISPGFTSGTCGGIFPASPSLEGRTVFWLEAEYDCDNDRLQTNFHAYSVRGDRNRYAWPPGARFPHGGAGALAVDGATTYWTTSDQREPPGCPRHGCALMRDRVRFRAGIGPEQPPDDEASP
jgi:hypothetical protein